MIDRVFLSEVLLSFKLKLLKLTVRDSLSLLWKSSLVSCDSELAGSVGGVPCWCSDVCVLLRAEFDDVKYNKLDDETFPFIWS